MTLIEQERVIAAFIASARQSRAQRAVAASALLKALTVLARSYRATDGDPAVLDVAITAIAQAKAAGITMEGL